MAGTYDVSVSSSKISNFKNTNADMEYFIALEPESYYTWGDEWKTFYG